jgi:NitT/TauT family transport system ATP-binding protein
MKLVNIKKTFSGLTVFDSLNLELTKGGITAVLGPSGCGKSTLLNIISGLQLPDSGELLGFDGLPLSFLFQEPRLLPWKTVKENICFILNTVMEKKQAEETADIYIDMVGLKDFSSAFPVHLSGGMKQRAAIARAFAYPAELMLLDEPFQALDLKRKLALVNTFIGLWIKTSRTAVFVTHDIQEALLLGDKIMVFSESPAEIILELDNPRPAQQRSLSSDETVRLEKELYKALLG